MTFFFSFFELFPFSKTIKSGSSANLELMIGLRQIGFYLVMTVLSEPVTTIKTQIDIL